LEFERGETRLVKKTGRVRDWGEDSGPVINEEREGNLSVRRGGIARKAPPHTLPHILLLESHSEEEDSQTEKGGGANV